MSVTVLVKRVSGGRLQLKGVNNYKDLKKRGCRKLGLEVAKFWKMTIEGDKLEQATFRQRQLSSNKTIVFWSKLDRIKDLLEVELKDCLVDADEANGVYNFLEMQLGGIILYKRTEDEDWFEGVDDELVKKSEYMERKASSRIRKYYDTIAKVLKERTNQNAEVTKVLEELNGLLLYRNWEETIFESIQVNGKFECEGPDDRTDCRFYHIINPYRTLHGRLQFSAWEFDHRIEKSFVINKLEEAIMNNPRGQTINTQFFYDLFFTTNNLALVYTACHDRKPRFGSNTRRFRYDQVYVN